MGQQLEDFTEARIKHLEMLQDVIGRMANSSTGVKRMTMLVVGGAVAVSAKSGIATPVGATVNAAAGVTINVPLLGIVLLLLFWALDARYHQQERWLRRVFDEVRAESQTMRPDFRINPPESIRSQCTLWQSLGTWSTWPFYLSLVGFLALLWIVQ